MKIPGQTASAHAAIRDMSEPRFLRSGGGMPASASPYSSLIEDVLSQHILFRYKEELRKIARHPFTLHAGQSQPDNGSLGMRMTPVLSPEVLHGSIYSCSV